LNTVNGRFAGSAKSPCNKHWGAKFIWTGGYRINPAKFKTSAFVWKLKHGSIPVTYNKWCQYQPDNNAGDEYCINIYPVSAYGWNDMPCWVEGCFVCEIQWTQRHPRHVSMSTDTTA